MDVLITGVSGQDGSYLAELLLAGGARVTGLVHPHETVPPYLSSVRGHALCELIPCDLAEPAGFRRVLRSVRPERVFHLGAVSSPDECRRDPVLSRTVNVASVEVLQDWLQRDTPGARVLVCSSSQVFGAPGSEPHNEASPSQPVNEYGRQKQVVREIAQAMRASGHFMACAIPYNHESPRRPEAFVMAKVCRSTARIVRGLQRELILGDTTARRDWGYAPEYAQAFAWMLEVERPGEFVLATGETRSVDELVKLAFTHTGLDPRRYVIADPAEHPSVSPPLALADPARAWEELGWEARTKFKELVPLLVDAALDELA